MRPRSNPQLILERTLLVLLIALLLLISPIKYLWSNDQAPWYSLYLVWLLIILLGRILIGRIESRDL
jgi:hypothetical protein